MDERVLVLAPRGRDGEITCALLAQHGFATTACVDLASLIDQLQGGAGLALITEEALRGPHTASLLEWVKNQPRWSDFPFVIVSGSGTIPRTAEAFATLEALGNLVLLERPLQTEALVRATRSALQARRRQYEVREFATTLEAAVAARTRELETAREGLSFALEAADMGSWDLDLATDASRRTLRHDQIFGYDELQPEWGRRRFLEHVATADRGWVEAKFEDAAKTGALELECRIVRRDGATRWIAVKGRVLYDSADVPIRMTGVVSDVSERREADTQIAQAQKMDTIGQLTGGVAHDFNNLLTPIVGGLDLLRKRHPNDQQSVRLIGAAQQAAEKAATLTQRLLAFARRQVLQPQAVDVAALIEGLVELASRTLGPAIEISIEVLPDVSAARVDPNQLELALLNLAVNARDAMPSGGRLTITGENATLPEGNAQGLTPGDYVCIKTSDTGIGMDGPTLERAIEPFFSTKGPSKGTGLGLSMAHGLAAQSGGALIIESTPGAGTTVSLLLPATARESTPRADMASPAATVVQSAAILVVDDEDLVRGAIADMLTDLGYRVVQASSASRALDLLRSGLEVDLVLSDYLMPGMSGGTLYRELCACGLHIPMLIITGYASVANDLPPTLPRIGKPFRQGDLAVRIRALLADEAGRQPAAEGARITGDS